jgi:hypothetical protein
MGLHKELAAAFRKTASPDIGHIKENDSSVDGYTWRKVELALVINSAGELVNLDRPPWRIGARRSSKALLIPPQQFTDGGGFSGFLWGHSSHALGIGRPNRERGLRAYPEAFNRFRTFHRAVLGRAENASIRAFLLFLERWDPETAALGDVIDEAGATVVFRFHYDDCFLHDSHAARLIWKRLANPTGASPDAAGAA